MQSNQFPINHLPKEYIPDRYKRVKVWNILSSHGEHTIYGVKASDVRNEFKRLKPTATIISITRNS